MVVLRVIIANFMVGSAISGSSENGVFDRIRRLSRHNLMYLLVYRFDNKLRLVWRLFWSIEIYK